MNYLALGFYLSGAVLVRQGFKSGFAKHSNFTQFLVILFWPVLSVVLLIAWVIK